MSAINKFCEKCNGLRKKYCDGDRNICMFILFDIIESLQEENEQLQSKLDDWKYEVQCHMDEVIAREKQMAKIPIERWTGDEREIICPTCKSYICYPEDILTINLKYRQFCGACGQKLNWESEGKEGND